MRALVLAVTFLLVVPAWAGIYLEPYAGYMEATSNSSYTLTSPVTASVSSKSNANGFGYGGKAGLSFDRLAIGADYLGASVDSAGSNSTVQNIGAFLQVSLPMFKISGTYYPSAQDQGSSNGDTSTEKGTGFKIGVGFSVFPHVSINLDYFSLHYTSASNSLNYTFSNVDDTVSGGLLSVSLPFNL